MANVAEPPFLLDSARVVMYAQTGGRASYTGKMTIHANGKWLDPVPRIAICEDLVDGDILIFHCDDAWKVLAAGGAKSVSEAQQAAEAAYSGMSSKWISYRPLTLAEASELDAEREELRRLWRELPKPDSDRA